MGRCHLQLDVAIVAIVAIARGDALLVPSHAAGGQWLAVLDGRTGGVTQRVTFTQ